MQTPEQFAALLDRCAHTAEEMGERLTDTYRVADLIRARDAEVRADERAKVLAGFTEERGLRTPGGVDLRLTPNVRDIDIDPPPPGLTLTRRLVGPWEPTP